MTVIDDAVAHDVRTYAAQVRAALAGLGAEQVDDLTDGLEANLADALADDRRRHGGGSLTDEFGSPAAYAEELRTAAGLAPTEAVGPGGFRSALGAPWRATVERARQVLTRLRATRWWPPVEDLLVALRPAWWVLRGWALAHVLLQMSGADGGVAFWLPSSMAGWVLLGLAVVASAQWGRGRWRTGPRWRRALLLLSAVLAVVTVVLLVGLPDQQGKERAMLESEVAVAGRPSDGVVVDGERAFNLFVYDADGQPVDGAQVVDQRGRPVLTDPGGNDRWHRQKYWPDGASEPTYHVGVPGPGGQLRWNVYPLHSLTEGGWSYDGTGQEVVADPDLVRAPAWPFADAGAVRAWGGDAVTSTKPRPVPSPTPGSAVEGTDPGAADAASSEAPSAGDASDAASAPDPDGDAPDGDVAPPAAP
jgi:hypothetical protein